MVDTNLKFWSTLAFAAFKRRPENVVFGYKRNVIKMRNAHGKRIESLLKKPNREIIDLELDNNLETAHVSRIRELLLRDARAPAESILRIFRNGKARNQGQIQEISNWKQNSLLFKNPLSPRYGLPLSKLNAHQEFSMNQTIQLESRDGRERLDYVLWPSGIFSNSCRGIGIPREVYLQYEEKYSKDELPKLISPVNTDSLLKLFPVDFVPKDCQAVGLFPQYVGVHKDVFKGIDLFGALVKSRSCTDAEIMSVNRHVTKKYPRPSAVSSPSDIDLEGVDVQGRHGDNDLQVQTNLENLSKWMNFSKEYNSFWGARNIPDRSIPADILRCIFLTRDITVSQMKEEFCKHYILFSIFSQAWRLDRRFQNKSLFISESFSHLPWKPWDIYIWQRSKELSAIPAPNTTEEFTNMKLRFDQFLSEFFSYYALIVSEMKAEAESFFQPTESQLPRIVPVNQVFRQILLQNQWIQMLYPNLHTQMENRFQWVHRSNYSAIPDTELDQTSRKSNEKLLTIVRIILELDNESRQNRLGQRGGIYVDRKTPASNWKIAIVNNSLTDPEVRRLLKFNTDISLLFTQNLEYLKNENGWYCQKRKMLDPDTYFYLYRNENHTESRKDLIDTIVDRFEQHKGEN